MRMIPFSKVSPEICLTGVSDQLYVVDKRSNGLAGGWDRWLQSLGSETYGGLPGPGTIPTFPAFP